MIPSLFVPVSILIGSSLLMLASVSSTFFYQQLMWVGLAAIAIIAMRFIDWRGLLTNPVVYAPYALSIVLLTVVLFVGPVVRNIKGWLVIGPVSFQPVELAKLALILVYARYLSRAHVTIARYATLFTSLGLVAIPLGLVMLQPDLGSGVILGATWFGCIVASGLPKRRIIAAVLVGIIGAVAAWSFVLAPYQKARIIAVMHPDSDPLGINYSTNQAKIAVGSAGIFGKGFGQGTQVQLDFLTEPQGDFALAAFIEEWGMVGAAVVLSAFFYLIVGILRIGAQTPRNTERLVTLGVALSFTVQAGLNAGSTLGLLPVVGVPFPFLSYGGSSLLISALMLGIVNAIAYRSRH
jgi:rod shape determining protein RodA